MKDLRRKTAIPRKRVIAILLSILMVLSIILPSGGSGVRYNAYAEGEESALGEGVEITTEEITDDPSNGDDNTESTPNVEENTSAETADTSTEYDEVNNETTEAVDAALDEDTQDNIDENENPSNDINNNDIEDNDTEDMSVPEGQILSDEEENLSS